MTDDPLERLHDLAAGTFKGREHSDGIMEEPVTLGDIAKLVNPPVPDLSMHLKPLGGILPKRAVLRLQSTGEIVAECPIDKNGDTLHFKLMPPMSGSFLLEFYPDTIEEAKSKELDDERYPDC